MADLLDDLNTPALLAKLHTNGVPKWFDEQILKLRVGVTEEIVVPDNISQLAAQRWEAKKAKDFATADALRAELAALGWEMREGKDEYELKPLV